MIRVLIRPVEGSANPVWLELPMAERSLEAALDDALGDPDQDYAIVRVDVSDYDSYYQLNPADMDLTELNKLAWILDHSSVRNIAKIFAVADQLGYTLLGAHEALQKGEVIAYAQYESLAEFAKESVREGLWGEISEDLIGFIDFEKMADSLSADYDFDEDRGVVIRV